MNYKKIFYNLFPVLFAICFQVQTQIMLCGTELNLSLSDIVLVLVLSGAVIFQRKEIFKRFASIDPLVYFLCFLFFVLITLSFIKGTQDSWAIKKYFGFYILFGYFFARFFLNEENFNITLFSKAFVLVFVLTAFLSILSLFFGYEFFLGLPLRTGLLTGFSFNPNIFGFLGCMALSIHLSYWKKFSWHKISFSLVLLAEIFFIYRSGSRASWVCGTFVLIYDFFKFSKSKLKNFIVIGALIVIFVELFSNPSPKTFSTLNTLSLPREKAFQKDDPSLRFRIFSAKDAVDLIQEKPFFGHGLGFAQNRALALVPYPLVIHNTALWIGSEMGIITLIVLSILLIILLRNCLRKAEETKNPFFYSIFLIVLMSALFSCFHEILFQRILWFLMGFCALLKPSTKPTQDL